MNGNGATGTAVSGFEWWNFTFPTSANTGANAISSFVSATGGVVNFGGSAGTFNARGESYAVWNDPANPNGWAIPWAVLMPKPAPLGIVQSGYSIGTGTFTMIVTGGVNTVPVTLSTTSGSATLAYQIDRANNVVTVSSIDLTTSGGQNAVTSNLVAGTPVEAFGVPQSDGSLKAYVVFYYTGTKPTP